MAKKRATAKKAKAKAKPKAKVARKRATWGIPAKVQAAAAKARKAGRAAKAKPRPTPRIRAPKATKGLSSFQRAILKAAEIEEKRAKAAKAAAPKGRKNVYVPPKPAPAWSWGREREPRVLPAPEEVVFRGPRGRLLSKMELAKSREHYRIEREFSAKIKEEKELKARLHPIPDKRRHELMNVLKRLAKAMEAPNLDFRAEISTDFDGHAMHAKVELTGITSVKTDEQMSVDQVNALVMAIIAQLKRQKIRKGMLIQLSFIPQESVYLQYGRDGDLMTTSWAMVNKSSEVEAFAPAAQRMVAAMVRNGWDVTSLRAMLFYDQTVAEGVPVKTSGGSSKKRRRR